ncbi:MAG TPA: M56 family metallopeptidase [Gemmatimonadaceae bacterium]|nr:M56 family metallopeptidase [Gemmatimonadaceae bacterium]
MIAAAMPFVAAADSARAASTMYTVSLLATVPMVLAAGAALALRRASAEGRVLVWRCAIVALLLVFVGRALPQHWMASVMSSTLAAPLIALGRAQMAAMPATQASTNGGAANVAIVELVLAAYAIGVMLVLLPTIVALWRARELARRGRIADGEWQRILDDARATLGITRRVQLVVSGVASVPATWGVIRPVVVVPESASEWSAEQRRMVVLHELAHVRASDWTFKLLARLVCALYWFHPGAWWLARGFDTECELACDDRVIASGARRSDYAELLVSAADGLLPIGAALALSRRRGLRGRLASVLDVRHDVRPLARRWTLAAVVATIAVAGPVSAVQLAPTRDVLTSLMRDARWETRAYAVIGLASRADSVAVARTAAERDPSPSVRAWARYALGERNIAGAAGVALVPIHQ